MSITAIIIIAIVVGDFIICIALYKASHTDRETGSMAVNQEGVLVDMNEKEIA